MSDRSSNGRLPELDGLRGIAILLVWVGHYFAIPASGAVRYLDGYWFRLGWTGVDLFLVLSGFLIGGILLEVRNSPSYFRTFYARRFFRIIPLYYAWIAIYILLSVLGRRYLTMHVGTVEGLDVPILAHLLFLQNFRDIIGSTVSFWWFTSTWSLALEEQFYLVVPLCVRYLTKRGLTFFLVLVAFAAPVARLFVRENLASGAWLAYRLMPCRADSLAIGMLAAISWTTPGIRDWLRAHGTLMYGLLAILSAGVAYLWRWHSDPLLPLTQTIGYTWLALFFAATILLVLTRPSEPFAFVARIGFLREIGNVSYCIYIIHLAVFLFCHQLLLHSMPAITDGKAAAVTIFAAVMTYGLAKLSWEFFEGPMVRRGHAYKY